MEVDDYVVCGRSSPADVAKKEYGGSMWLMTADNRVYMFWNESSNASGIYLNINNSTKVISVIKDCHIRGIQSPTGGPHSYFEGDYHVGDTFTNTYVMVQAYEE